MLHSLIGIFPKFIILHTQATSVHLDKFCTNINLNLGKPDLQWTTIKPKKYDQRNMIKKDIRISVPFFVKIREN